MGNSRLPAIFPENFLKNTPALWLPEGAALKGLKIII
jgi:hypothetical protein